MLFCSVWNDKRAQGAILLAERVVTFSDLNKQIGTKFPEDLLGMISDQNAMAILRKHLRRVVRSGDQLGKGIAESHFSPPFLNPPKIIGIGLNYAAHAADFGEFLPSEPASFMKPRTTIIGPGDQIVLPEASGRVTAEAELGVAIGKRCKHLGDEEADEAIFGYVPVLDMTAEDILRKNPRFLTRAKSFDTFFSFGPVIVTPDEVKNLSDLTVSTVLNGRVIRSNKVGNMIFSPSQLIAFHSQVMTFEPGDIIAAGTPGAVVIHDGDVVECRIDGFPALTNPVKGAR